MSAGRWRGRQAALLPAAMLVLATAMGEAAAAPREERYLGFASEQGSGRYLYTEVHRHQYDGRRWLGGSIRYVAPDGSLLGEKQLDFRADPHVPLMQYRLRQPAYEERITAVDAGGMVLEKRSQGRVERKRLARVPGQAADSGFNAFLVDHLDDLAAGRSVSLRFAVVGQLDQYRFRVKPLGRLTLAGEPALRLRVEPDSLLRLLVDPLEVVYGLQTRQLLRYQGVSNILDPVTGKAHAVVISYRDKPRNAPAVLPSP